MNRERIKTFFDDMSRGRDKHLEGDSILNYEQQMRQKSVIELLEPSKGETILDVGCGNARDMIEFFKLGAKPIGIDLSLGMLKEGRKENLKDAQFILGDATSLPFKDNTFDKISCSEVIEHIPNWHNTIKEMKRVLKPKGLLIITTPNMKSLYGLNRIIFDFIGKIIRKKRKHPYDEWKTQKEVIGELEKNGFKIKKKIGICFIPGHWSYKLSQKNKKKLISTIKKIEPKIKYKLSEYGYSLGISAKKNVNINNSKLTEKILRENIIVHRKEAEIYDFIHSEIFNKYEQRKTIDDINYILALSKKEAPCVLDIGCGTGNLTLKFLEFGCKVTALDISKEMLSILSTKANDNKLLKIINWDIDSFLETNNEKYDIISFSSVLHHLPDYKLTIKKLFKILNNNGILYITHEPLVKKDTTPMRIIRFLLNLGYKLKISKLKNKIKEINYSYADFHSKSGIDYIDLVNMFKKNSFVIEKITKYRAEKSSISARFFNTFFKTYPNNFKLIANRR